MRRILIDYAKTKHRIRRGGNQGDLPLENALAISVSETGFDLLAARRPAIRCIGEARRVEVRLSFQTYLL